MLRPYLQYLFGRCWNRIAVSRATPLGHHSVTEKLRYLCSSQELCWLLAPGTTPRKQPATSTGFSSPEVWQVQTRGITHKYHMADNTWQLQCREKTLKASAGVFIQCTSYYSSHTFYKYIWKKNSHGADSNNEKILFGPQQQLAEIQRGIQLPTCPTNIPYGSVMPYSKSKGFMSMYCHWGIPEKSKENEICFTHGSYTKFLNIIKSEVNLHIVIWNRAQLFSQSLF